MISTTDIAATLQRHVVHLAGTIGERHAWAKPKLDQARDYIYDALQSSGLEMAIQTYAVGNQTFDNIEATLPGESDKILLVGAHYDSVRGTPGADDNASGVSALLTLAELINRELTGESAVTRTPKKTLRFVAFTNEEAPFARTDTMGSLVYAKMAQARGDQIAKTLILEMLGYYSDEKGSQQYPRFIGPFFPSRADYIAVVSNLQNIKLVFEVAGRLKKKFPVEKLAAPTRVRGIDYSDHQSFWKVGYPAVMITDTAFFRNPHYHTAGDRPETLDYDRMARLVLALQDAIYEL